MSEKKEKQEVKVVNSHLADRIAGKVDDQGKKIKTTKDEK